MSSTIIALNPTPTVYHHAAPSPSPFADIKCQGTTTSGHACKNSVNCAKHADANAAIMRVLRASSTASDIPASRSASPAAKSVKVKISEPMVVNVAPLVPAAADVETDEEREYSPEPADEHAHSSDEEESRVERRQREGSVVAQRVVRPSTRLTAREPTPAEVHDAAADLARRCGRERKSGGVCMMPCKDPSVGCRHHLGKPRAAITTQVVQKHAVEATTIQFCCALTRNGEGPQCSRKAVNGGEKCAQHQKMAVKTNTAATEARDNGGSLNKKGEAIFDCFATTTKGVGCSINAKHALLDKDGNHVIDEDGNNIYFCGTHIKTPAKYVKF